MQKVNYLLFTVIVAALLAISGCSERVPQERVQDRNDEMADTSMILNEKPTSLENVMEATRVDIERLMESQSPSDFLGADGIELDYAAVDNNPETYTYRYSENRLTKMNGFQEHPHKAL